MATEDTESHMTANLREEDNLGKKIKLFGEGQILIGILSFILYCQYGILNLIRTSARKFHDHTGGSLAGHSPDANNTEKM